MSARDTLVALGASLLAAGLLARLGRRIGLPTIPLFMIAGLLFGPNTPGIQLVDHPADFELLATLGLILLLFYLGLEFSLGELTAGGRSLALGRMRSTSASTSPPASGSASRWAGAAGKRW